MNWSPRPIWRHWRYWSPRAIWRYWSPRAIWRHWSPGLSEDIEDIEAPGLSEDIEAPGLSEDIEAPGLSEDIEAPGLSEDIEAPGLSEDIEASGLSEDIEAPGLSEDFKVTTQVPKNWWQAISTSQSSISKIILKKWQPEWGLSNQACLTSGHGYIETVETIL